MPAFAGRTLPITNPEPGQLTAGLPTIRNQATDNCSVLRRVLPKNEGHRFFAPFLLSSLGSPKLINRRFAPRKFLLSLRRGIDAMPQKTHYEILVIGSGEAGKYLAWTMAKAGREAAVVERSLIGGSCPNVACLPSKNVIYSAKVASLARRGLEFGLPTGTIDIDMNGVRARKRSMVDGLVQVHLDQYRATGTELIMGEARFIGPKKIEVQLREGGTIVLTGDRVFLNLGSRASIPDVPGLREARPLTHVEALDLDRLPQRLIVLGGGYVGLELAQAMRRLGAHVTLVQRGPQLARGEDPDVAESILNVFRAEGIDVILDARTTAVRGTSGQQVNVSVQTSAAVRDLEGSDLLAATGRTPNTQGIGLERAGVELDSRDYIKVNERLETTAPEVWAMGDCAGSPLFTHVAYDDYRVVRDNLLGISRTTRDRLIPFCLFTDPELARVGLNEKQARERGIPYRLLKIPAKADLRTLTLSETGGFLKALIDAHTERILGFTGFMAEAGELMSVVQTAMLAGMPYTTLKEQMIFAHPTMAEGLMVLFRSAPQAASATA